MKNLPHRNTMPSRKNKRQGSLAGANLRKVTRTGTIANVISTEPTKKVTVCPFAKKGLEPSTDMEHPDSELMTSAE